LSPVAGFGPARAGIDLHDRVASIPLPRQKHFELKALGVVKECDRIPRQFVLQLRTVVFGGGEIA
jgi:hypothetical protein